MKMFVLLFLFLLHLRDMKLAVFNMKYCEGNESEFFLSMICCINILYIGVKSFENIQFGMKFANYFNSRNS